jgi:hypothetical protein
MTEITKEQKQEAVKKVDEQLNIARTAIKEAERLAIEFKVDFSFSVGDGYGDFETNESRDGTVYGEWYGWQGSNC